MALKIVFSVLKIKYELLQQYLQMDDVYKFADELRELDLHWKQHVKTML